VRPYYSDSLVTLYHGDCREVLPTLDGTFAVVSDPPYGVALENRDVDGHRSPRSFSIAGDSCQTLGLDLIAWAGETRTLALFASPWLPWPGRWRNLIVWDKGGAVGGGGDPTTCLKRSWELIQVNNVGPLLQGRQESVWRFPIVPAETASHIAAKPVGLLVRLVSSFCAPGQIVLDPCAGSGSALVAAKDLGRRAIGIEIEERYCEIAAERCRQEVLDFGGAA
jgi:hypothetical protein